MFYYGRYIEKLKIMFLKEFKKRYKKIKSNQKFSEFYSIYFSSHVSCFLTAIFSFTRISPNQITIAMIFFGIIGSLIVATGSHISIFIGSLFMIFLNILDASDGELARFQNRTSLLGDYLDRYGHYVTNSLFFLGIGIALYKISGSILFLYLAILIEISYTGDELLRDLLITCGLQKQQSNRKDLKFKTKIIINKNLKIFNIFLKVTSTNLGFFHLTFIISIVDYLLLNSMFFMYYYFIFFSIITFAKFLIRIKLIKNYVESKN